jgi:hypothetical protein
MGREVELVVVLDGDEIVVTKPGTLLLLAYRNLLTSRASL